MDKQLFNKLSARIAELEDDMIQMQAEITAMPALGPENGGEGEIKRAEYLKKFLTKLNPSSLIEIKAPDDRIPSGYRPNLLAIFNGKKADKTIWIMSHMDIVPPGEAKLWNSDPYKIEVKDGKIFGRGVEDNQQGLVGSLFAVKALRDLNIIPEYNIGLTLVADEETGSEKGLGYLMQEAKDHFSKNDLIIIPDAGEADASMIEVAEKSIYWMEFHVAGKQCHGSTPEAGINAHKAGAHLIVKLDSLHQLFDAVDPVFDPPISTFEPTKKEANVPNINTIPGEDVFCFDCRILPSYSFADIEKAVRDICDDIEQDFGVKVTMTSPQKEEAAPATPIDAPVVGALKKAVKDVYQVDASTVGIGGGTVAAFFRRAGFNAAVWSTLEDMCHQPNEYCVISNMVNDAKVFGHVFLQG